MGVLNAHFCYISHRSRLLQVFGFFNGKQNFRFIVWLHNTDIKSWSSTEGKEILIMFGPEMLVSNSSKMLS